MKQYQSHKTVEAAKILGMDYAAGGARLHLEGFDPESVFVEVAWLNKHKPSPSVDLVGGYFLRYSDGYQSWSPAEAFEQGYREKTFDPKDGALPVAGYKPQTQTKVDCVNAMKVREELILQQLDFMSTDEEIDQRWLAAGRLAIEQGFMAINRSIFRPGRVVLTKSDPAS